MNQITKKIFGYLQSDKLELVELKYLIAQLNIDYHKIET